MQLGLSSMVPKIRLADASAVEELLLLPTRQPRSGQRLAPPTCKIQPPARATEVNATGSGSSPLLFAQQKLLDGDEAVSLRDSHSAWYGGRIHHVGLDVQLLSLDHISWFQRNMDNVRSAIDWAVARRDLEAAAVLVMSGSAGPLGGSLTSGSELLRLNDDMLELDLLPCHSSKTARNQHAAGDQIRPRHH